ncbi:MAG: YggS family pyridoxal phosphate-dependent enzyme [Solirubrobacteraceae bacterium]
MAELIAALRAERVRENLARVREQIALAAARAGRDPAGVEVLAATKYVRLEDMPALTRAGVRLVGENRAQDLNAKAALHGELFVWDFIGRLQSRRVPLIVPHVRLIHSLAGESALRALERNRGEARPGLEVLIQVNVAREPGKGGVLPEELPLYLERSPFPVAGLMTMPPLTTDPEASRPWFAALRELAGAHGLARLSMGTSQDYPVAVEEGATTLRLGASLYT